MCLVTVVDRGMASTVHVGRTNSYLVTRLASALAVSRTSAISVVNMLLLTS